MPTCTFCLILAQDLTLITRWCPHKVQVEPGCIAQSVMCLTTDVCLIAAPWVVSLIPGQSYTFVEIDLEIFSTVILLLPLFQEGLVSVTSESICLKCWLTAKSSLPRKNVIRLIDRLNMTISVDWGIKPQTKQKKNLLRILCNYNVLIRSNSCLLLQVYSLINVDTLFMRIPPSLHDRFFISWKLDLT